MKVCGQVRRQIGCPNASTSSPNASTSIAGARFYNLRSKLNKHCQRPNQAVQGSCEYRAGYRSENELLHVWRLIAFDVLPVGCRIDESKPFIMC